PAATHYDYWPDSLVKDIIYPNGVIEDYGFTGSDGSYDDAGRLTFVVSHTGAPGQLPAANQIISSFQYTYDPNGNRLSQTEVHSGLNGGAPVMTNYQYDRL